MDNQLVEVIAPLWGWVKAAASDNEFLAVARFLAAILAIAVSLVTLYLRLREKASKQRGRVAIAKNSWDVHSKFPIFPLPELSDKVAFFPFIPPNLESRKKSDSGWFTATVFRIWNAGGKDIHGSSLNPTTYVYINIPNEVDNFNYRLSFTNDLAIACHLGRLVHSPIQGLVRIPVCFDVLRPSKGFIVTVWHNKPTDEGFSASAASTDVDEIVVGTSHVFKRGFVKFMNRIEKWLPIPLAIISGLLLSIDRNFEAILALVFAWMMLLSLYLQRGFVLPPDDLVIGYELKSEPKSKLIKAIRERRI